MSLPREQRPAAIRAALEAVLAPVRLDIVDESHKHAGHAGARDGRGHFAVTVVSGRFGDGEALVNGTDFTVTVDANGESAKLVITNGAKVPGVGEDVKVSYVTEISKPTEQKGACGPQTTADAGT